MQDGFMVEGLQNGDNSRKLQDWNQGVGILS